MKNVESVFVCKRVSRANISTVLRPKRGKLKQNETRIMTHYKQRHSINQTLYVHRMSEMEFSYLNHVTSSRKISQRRN